MKPTSLRPFIFGAAAAASLVAHSVTTPASAQTKLLFNIFVPPNHTFTNGGFKPWAQDVERVTDGRVKVDFTTASLAPPPKQWNMVTSGIADVAMLANQFESRRITLPSIGGLPFLGDTSVQRGVALQRTYDKFFAKSNEFKGVKLVALFTNSGAGIIANKEIDTIDDLKGTKLWSMSGRPAGYMKSIGAVPVPGPGPAMFDMFSKGVVDGVATNPGALPIWNLYRYTKSLNQVPGGIYAVDFSIILSQRKWDGISAKDREAIDAISGEKVALGIGKAVDDLDVKALKETREKGIKIAQADSKFMAAMSDRLKSATDNWLKKAAARGVDGEAAIAYFKSQVK